MPVSWEPWIILYIVTFLLHAMTCDQPQDEASTPMLQRKFLFPDEHNANDLSCTLHQSAGNETVRSKLINLIKIKNSFAAVYTFVATFHYCPALQITTNSSHLGDSVFYAEIQVNKCDAGDLTMGNKAPVWPTVGDML